VGSAHNLSVSLEPEQTQILLEEVPTAYGVNIQSVLLAALARALQEWTESPSLWVELEEHGREELFDDVDLTRTVGWFTCIYPVRLELDPAGASPKADMRAVEQQLGSVPHRGLGFGVLRYLGEGETSRRLRAQPTPGVSFNYLGQFDRLLPSAVPFRPAQESGGRTHSGRGKRFRQLDVNAMVLEGRLRIQWAYSENVHHRETVEKLARNQLEVLKQWIAHFQAVTPEVAAAHQETSKFAEFDWAQEDVAQIVELLEERK
jgi:non-ribosomal peptide synthase protein (TIGR01720 family)